MTGLVKAKKYDWTDSNMALFGSDTEKQVKKESAQTEPAWQGAGSAPGLKIWRIEQFEVKDWPTSKYGQFYNGDSYIVLNTYKDKESDNLLHDVHFWIGKNSTQDEYGTAAYKTVELDTYLDDVPIQHRECQGHESSLFKSYFPNGITTMEGGAESGFSHVAPEEYEARLFKFVKEQRNVVVRQIPRCPALVVPGDVYILDLGLKIYQYNGEESSPMERSKAMQYVGTIKSERGEATSQVLEGATTSTAHEFWTKLDQSADEDIDDDDDGIEDKKLLRVNTDTAQSELVKDGDFALNDLKSDDVFICDSGETVFVWVGANASGAEKRNGLPYAHNYLRGSGRPWRSITVVREGQRCPQFDSALAA
ncbi:gelsolin-like protein 2 [Physella acuta]|uniref:gelsolin-like protein 2 n=1 Tax=Physella acuta TaxID=109671 RepID=UPI0027DC0AEC|nr:gelsolin-like protein 2 [Physella acuta]XP_059151108.1 gelsolin-like protein 2 [Physella acuta]XP_059151109.1 gelsolin-like protein 2 [Physella acuta]XP_059151110.1 gelsolin-like protein 2 [Physella acuta]XP_059151111.1 gelsolin-like protein 2 [Physella acuta]XP_059151112.1 gelsolin-like protein 2 [Physella acuta]XP_059151113.1 gelsolin-like protein 2 [Physella acuta]